MNISEVDLHKLTVSDPFLGQYQQLVRDVVIPYQWDALIVSRSGTQPCD